MPSRKIEDLIPEAQTAILEFESRLRERGLLFFKRCCTYRSQQEQNALWLRGRRSLVEVNEAYQAVGLSPITLQENKRPVTWTTASLHTSREAVDYYIEKNGRYVSDIKADINDNDIPDWEEFGKIAADCGLDWGGFWKKPDRPHVQLRR
jgi:peptidoglycan L-alanyl-D-glutamate endopeptidase CwlK